MTNGNRIWNDTHTAFYREIALLCFINKYSALLFSVIVYLYEYNYIGRYSTIIQKRYLCLNVLPLEALELHHGVVKLERAAAPAPGHPPPLLCLGLFLSVTIHLVSLLLSVTCI